MLLYEEKLTNTKARDKTLRKKFIVKMISQKKENPNKEVAQKQSKPIVR
jgi:hypothetical protein